MLTIETKEVRVVSFNIDTYSQFKGVLNKGLLLSNLSPSENDYLFVDDFSFKSVEPKFLLKRFPKPATTLEDVVNKCPLYARVTIRVIVTEIEPPQTYDSLTFVACQVIDTSDRSSRQLTLYNNLVNLAKVNNCYEMTEITINKYMGHRILKSSDQSTIHALPSDTISVEPFHTDTVDLVGGNIINVAFDTLNAELLCPNCKSTCEADENIIICSKPKCNTVSAVSMAVSKCILKFTIENESKNHLMLQPR